MAKIGMSIITLTILVFIVPVVTGYYEFTVFGVVITAILLLIGLTLVDTNKFPWR